MHKLFNLINDLRFGYYQLHYFESKACHQNYRYVVHLTDNYQTVMDFAEMVVVLLIVTAGFLIDQVYYYLNVGYCCYSMKCCHWYLIADFYFAIGCSSVVVPNYYNWKDCYCYNRYLNVLIERSLDCCLRHYFDYYLFSYHLLQRQSYF